MILTPYRRNYPIRNRSNMISLFDEFFNRAFEEESNDDANFRAMAMDIMEHDEEYEILANLPGFKKENVKISIHDNQLHIEASCESKSDEKQGSMYRCERYSGNYRRNLLLPDNADHAKINAKMEDGVLRLIIPKKEATPQKEIVIE